METQRGAISMQKLKVMDGWQKREVNNKNKPVNKMYIANNARHREFAFTMSFREKKKCQQKISILFFFYFKMAFDIFQLAHCDFDCTDKDLMPF